MLVSALAAGKIDAAFLHLNQWLSLKQQTHGFHKLLVMDKVVPEVADSYLAANPSWLKAHPNTATAICEAWLRARQILHHHPRQWVHAAEQYINHTLASSFVKEEWRLLNQNNVIPDNASGFSPSTLRYNEQLVYRNHEISKAPPLSDWVVETFWKTAAKAVYGPSPSSHSQG